MCHQLTRPLLLLPRLQSFRLVPRSFITNLSPSFSNSASDGMSASVSTADSTYFSPSFLPTVTSLAFACFFANLSSSAVVFTSVGVYLGLLVFVRSSVSSSILITAWASISSSVTSSVWTPTFWLTYFKCVEKGHLFTTPSVSQTIQASTYAGL